MSFSGASVVRGATQAGAADTVVSFDTETYDQGGWWDAGAPTRLTVPSGVTHVQLTGRVNASAIASGELGIRFTKNGSILKGAGRHGSPDSNTSGRPRCLQSGVLGVTPGDYFELQTETADAAYTIEADSYLAIESILNFSGAQVVLTADDLTVDASTGVVRNWDAEVIDVGGWWDAGAPGVFTVPAGITYAQVGGCFDISLSANNAVLTVERDRGGSVTTWATSTIPHTTTMCISVASPPIPVAAGDLLRLRLTCADTSITIHQAESNMWVRGLP